MPSEKTAKKYRLLATKAMLLEPRRVNQLLCNWRYGSSVTMSGYPPTGRTMMMCRGIGIDPTKRNCDMLRRAIHKEYHDGTKPTQPYRAPDGGAV